MKSKERGYEAWAARWRVPLGFAASIAYALLARPTLPFLIAGIALVLAGLAVRAWAAGTVEKSARLATSGPYARTRNPLYFGSSLLAAGFTLAGRSLVMAAAVAALLVFIYAPVIRREAEFLESKFGDEYRRYAANVPMFLPAPGRRMDSAGRFAWSRYMKNREYEAALGCAAGVAFLVLRTLHWIPDLL